MSVFPEPVDVVDPYSSDANKTPRAPCPRCGVRLEPEFMEIHLQNHSKERPYACDMCDLTFDAKAKLENHLRTHTGERPFKCELCPKRFAQCTNMVNHMKTHKNSKHNCKACNMAFNFYKSLKKHEQSMLCPGRVIKKEIDNMSDVKIEDVVSNSRNMYQDTQQRASEERQTSSADPPIHSSESNAMGGSNKTARVCKICSAPFISSSLLANHILTCSSEKVPFHCEHCPRRFSKVHGMNIHLLRSHGIVKTNKNSAASKEKVKVLNRDVFACNLCLRTFNSPTSLRIHMNWHRRNSVATPTILNTQHSSAASPSSIPTSNPLHKCDICSSSFASIHAMRAHQCRAHAGIASAWKSVPKTPTSPWATNNNYAFECTLCSKKFETTRALKIHSSTHLDKNKVPYLCRKCGKTFSGIRALRIHEHYHIADKTMHECHVCGKSLPGMRALRLHSTMHRAANGVYQCRTLKAHKSEHTRKYTKKCKLCDKRFDKYGMRAHLLWHQQTGANNTNNPEMPNDRAPLKASIEPDEYLESDGSMSKLNLEPDEYMPAKVQKKVVTELKRDKYSSGDATVRSYSVPTPEKSDSPHILNRFACRQCPQRFRVRSALTVHMHTHKTKRKCEFCPRWFGTFAWYKKHLELHKKEGTNFLSSSSKASNLPGAYKCELCPKTFYTWKGLAVHGGHHKRYKPETKSVPSNSSAPTSYSCLKCNVTFENGVQLQGHNHTVHRHSSDSTNAEHSPFTVPSIPSKRKRHTFRCAHCSSMFTTKGLLYQHKRSGCSLTEQGLRNQELKQQLLFSSTNKETGSKHANVFSQQPVHSGYQHEAYQCPQCPKRFTSSWGLKYHATHTHAQNQIINYSTESPRRQFKCKACSMVFLGRALLQMHQKEAHGQYERRSSISSDSTHSSQLHDVTIEYKKPASTSGASIRLSLPVAPKTKLLKCRKCPKVFKNIKTLGTHLTLKHKIRYACKICLQSYNSFTGLYIHCIKHHQHDITDPEELYNSVVQGVNSCTICLTAFPTAEKLDRHRSSKHKLPILQANSFSNPVPHKQQSLQFSDLMPKRRQPSSIQRHYQCELCRKVYRSYNRLKRHKNILHGGCPVSDNEQMSSYLINTATVLESDSLQQESTGEQLSGARNAVSQVSAPSEVDLKQTRYPCSMCEEVFNAKQLLNDHLRTHFESTNLVDAKKMRKSEQQLEISNVRSEKDVKNVEMMNLAGQINSENIYSSEPNESLELNVPATAKNGDGLPKTADFATDISSGVVTTTVENLATPPSTSPTPGKLYNCSACSFSTFSQENLNQHRRDIHAQLLEKESRVSQHKCNHGPVDCPICSKTLSCRSALSTHMRIHTGLKPFMCETCGENFTYKQMLQRHAQRAHGISLTAEKIQKSNTWNGAAVMRHQQQSSPTSMDSDEQVNALLKIAEAAVAKPLTELLPDSATSNQPVFPQEETVNQPIFPTLYKCDQCSGLFQVESDLLHHKMVHEQTFRM